MDREFGSSVSVEMNAFNAIPGRKLTVFRSYSKRYKSRTTLIFGPDPMQKTHIVKGSLLNREYGDIENFW